jgi:membrane associated rhomboid family serine protease
MLYGILWYAFPKVDDTISWEGHLAGLITGVVLSLAYKTPEYKKSQLNMIGKSQILIPKKTSLCNVLTRTEFC